ncbi:hypothetical protein MIND_00958400 [Mycena indigotica]|uniref:Uncharacterized protein n=1 Tax=Mycena indigotica TaxID=2126181 RepID=A0A8H6SD38_9AGAR|nr:uncharacterized protein MIND_00958400 [Mycena indigotica]KAF7297253.1 hypothetical protein MIND_00958400 [Mycena indigotica]
MLVLDILDGGHEIEDQENTQIQACEHPRCPNPEFNFKVFDTVLKHLPLDYHKRIAALRFQDHDMQQPIFASTDVLPRVNDNVLPTYLDPVVTICNKYLLAESSTLFVYETQHVKDRQVARIYLQDTDVKKLQLIFYCIVRYFLSTSRKLKLTPEANTQAPKGQICWAGIPQLRDYVECSHVSELLEEFEDVFHEEKPKFILITDAERVLMISHVNDYHVNRSTFLNAYWLARGRQSLRHALCLLLCQAEECNMNTDPWPKFLQGALNDPNLIHASQQQQHTTFRDFDRFTLQRSLPYLKQFINWKRQESERLSAPFIGPGTMLAVDVNAFMRDESLWRSPFPKPLIPPSTKEFVGRNLCQRLRDVDEILSGGQNITFEVTEVIRHERDTFSQVFFGVLRAADGRVSAPICVKIFLDLLFPVDAALLLHDFETEDAMWRLSSLHCPEDLAKLEEAAYERLQEHQGTMVPHCYGFHRTTLQGKFTALGAIPMLPKMARHARECFRTLLYAGINQADFRPSQIMLPDGPEYRPERDSVVLIDFDFAFQRFGDEQRRNIAATMQIRDAIDLLEIGILAIQCEVHTLFRRKLFVEDTFHRNEW